MKNAENIKDINAAQFYEFLEQASEELTKELIKEMQDNPDNPEVIKEKIKNKFLMMFLISVREKERLNQKKSERLNIQEILKQWEKEQENNCEKQ